ncbi:MAG TPA: phospho-sugar mutase [Pseudonocardia sp.]|jgi:phosphomannomutase|uniref:phospho-sugar mutase n=1 Tax=Pseudonocardia sp. TaxID=60912 RepID=UPI002F41463F
MGAIEGPVPPAVREAARRWIADDPDPDSRAELTALLTSESGELAARMGEPARFGTAGIRAPLRAGPAGMNVAVVRRVTAGLADWLLEQGNGGATVVVGRDARHGSGRLAAATASVLAGAGFQVVALAEPLPTPVLCYAVRALGAAAGVQITASHNPPSDNGYKVYLGGADAGAPLVEPADAHIEAAIADAPPAEHIRTVDVAGTDPAGLVADYVRRVARLPRGGARGLRIALTPLHGVGGAVAVAALHAAGFQDVHLVPSQAEPDPDFPTVAFPNPEEPGATDELLRFAASVRADLAVALDPDADRCALGVPDPEAPGGWRLLSGNETGVLLGDHVLATMDDTARAAAPDGPLVASTLASSSQLRGVAAARGARFAETATGFKWIVRAGPGFVYGYEEALGYCVDPDTVRDKDGIAAAVLAADLAATRRAAGSSLPAALDELAVAHGLHLTDAVTVRMDPARRAETVRRLAERLGDEGGATVLRRERARAVIRPSGTEPKLKAYLEVVEPVADPGSLDGARARATRRLAALRAEVTALIT